MVLESLLLLAALLTPREPPALLTSPATILPRAAAPAYAEQARAVDNWRVQSALSLDMPAGSIAGWAFGREPDTPRCVKLNNYWCVKKAGWTGEIAADADGHVAFASAHEGAAVAAQLLRRYYIDYHRRSAREIASRWAPAQCLGVVPARPIAPRPLAARPQPSAARGQAAAQQLDFRAEAPSAAATMPRAPSLSPRVASRAGMARMLPQRIVPMGLAPHGIENTLRARWLAAHGRGGLAARPVRRTAVPARVADMTPTPSIMAGVREPAPLESRVRQSELPGGPLAPRPATDCSLDLVRIANYASRIAENVAPGPDDDLKLFTPDGLPTQNLAKVMANMAAVEIGPLRAHDALIAAAVAQLRAAATEPRAER